MNELSTEELRHELNNPGNWESLLKLSDELFRRLDIAEAQVAAWQRHDNDTAGTFCPQPHRMMSDER